VIRMATPATAEMAIPPEAEAGPERTTPAASAPLPESAPPYEKDRGPLRVAAAGTGTVADGSVALPANWRNRTIGQVPPVAGSKAAAGVSEVETTFPKPRTKKDNAAAATGPAEIAEGAASQQGQGPRQVSGSRAVAERALRLPAAMPGTPPSIEPSGNRGRAQTSPPAPSAQAKGYDPGAAQAKSTAPGADRPSTAPVELSPANNLATDAGRPRTTQSLLFAPPSRRPSRGAVERLLALSGQLPRSVESLAPAEPKPREVDPAAQPALDDPRGQPHSQGFPDSPAPLAAPMPERRSTLAPAVALPQPNDVPKDLPEGLVAGANVRALAASTPDRGEVAFAVQLTALPPSKDAAKPESAMRAHTPEDALRLPVRTPAREVPAVEPAALAAEGGQSNSQERSQAVTRMERSRRAETASAERVNAAGHTPDGAADGAPDGAPRARMIPNLGQEVRVRPEAVQERPGAATDQPVRPRDAPGIETGPDAAKAAGAVHDIKLEVTGGEQRVELRLSERGGELKLTVRTPDAQLASALRENLPALSSRLAESGLKSEAWHPAASTANEWRHTAESSAGGPSQDTNQDANSQPREQGREQQGRHPKSSQEQVPQKQKGKDFAWLISSLR
jgi:hypothetical protein